MWNYTCKELAYVVKIGTEHISKENFITLRNCHFSRFAAYNARRVTEVTTLQMKHMKDGLNGAWLNHIDTEAVLTILWFM